jgi:hypothetical protein
MNALLYVSLTFLHHSVDPSLLSSSQSFSFLVSRIHRFAIHHDTVLLSFALLLEVLMLCAPSFSDCLSITGLQEPSRSLGSAPLPLSGLIIAVSAHITNNSSRIHEVITLPWEMTASQPRPYRPTSRQTLQRDGSARWFTWTFSWSIHVCIYRDTRSRNFSTKQQK